MARSASVLVNALVMEKMLNTESSASGLVCAASAEPMAASSATAPSWATLMTAP